MTGKKKTNLVRLMFVGAMLYLESSTTFFVDGPWYTGGNETKLSKPLVYTFSSPLSGYCSLLHLTLFSCFLFQIVPYESFFLLTNILWAAFFFFFFTSVIIISLRCFDGKKAVVWSRDLCN